VGGRFKGDEEALSHIIEFSLALIILLFVLAGYFTAIDSEFTVNTPEDAHRERSCVRYSDLIIADMGMARNETGNTTNWENLNPDQILDNLTRPGLAAEGREFGIISWNKVIGLRNITYLNFRSILSMTRYHFNFEITELNGSHIAFFGYSSDGVQKISEVKRIVLMVGNDGERAVKFSFRLFEGIIRRSLLRVNEFMYQPEEGKGEWIELYNPTDEAADLTTFGFYTQGNSTFDRLKGDSLILPGKGYGLIIDAEETWYQYNIFAGTVKLLIKDNNIGHSGMLDDNMDFAFNGESFREHSYIYNNTMGGDGNGHSLEWSFLDGGGWRESTVEGGTPGRANSN